jgi:hypothetical protein
MVVAPFALLGASGGALVVAGPSVHAKDLGHIENVSNFIPAPTTTTTPSTTTVPAAPPTTVPVTTTSAPHVVVAPPITTTTAPPRNGAQGVATWFGTGAGSGYCASQVAPRGVVIRVTDTATGASITCLVNDYEAAGPPDVVDLAPGDFGQLASTSTGAIHVTISW